MAMLLVWLILSLMLLIYNHGHNILRIFYVLPISLSHKWNEAWLLVTNCYIRVASRVAERLKTLRILGN